jgi:hypothetical protein
MTVPIVGREARSTRRLRLLNLIARASEELMSLERADRRGPALNIGVVRAGHPRVPSAHA